MSMDLDLADCDDNEKATAALREWCQQLGYRIEAGKSDISFLLQAQRRWVLSVKAHPDENHRLVATCLFATHPGYMTKEEWFAFTNRLNVTYNICKFSFDDDHNFMIVYSLHFLEKISPRLFRNFIAHADRSLMLVFQQEMSVLEEALK